MGSGAMPLPFLAHFVPWSLKGETSGMGDVASVHVAVTCGWENGMREIEMGMMMEMSRGPAGRSPSRAELSSKIAELGWIGHRD